MFNEMQVSSGGGGSIDTQIKQIDVSSVNVSGTFDSSYSANNAIILNHTKNGWIPTRSATSGWIEIDFGSVKDVDFLFFENTGNNASTVMNGTTFDIEIYTTTSSTYGSADFTGTFTRTGKGFSCDLIRLGKQAQKIKVALSGSTLDSYDGYKLMAFGK